MSDDLVFEPAVRLSKWHDNLISNLTEEAHELIVDFGWDPDDLSQEQIDAIRTWVDEQDGYGYDFIMSGFRNVISWAENELWEKENNDNA